MVVYVGLHKLMYVYMHTNQQRDGQACLPGTDIRLCTYIHVHTLN